MSPTMDLATKEIRLKYYSENPDELFASSDLAELFHDEA